MPPQATGCYVHADNVACVTVLCNNLSRPQEADGVVMRCVMIVRCVGATNEERKKAGARHALCHDAHKTIHALHKSATLHEYVVTQMHCLGAICTKYACEYEGTGLREGWRSILGCGARSR